MPERDMGLKLDVLECTYLDLPVLWNKKLGVLESPGSLFTCVAPLTIIPFTAEGIGPQNFEGKTRDSTHLWNVHEWRRAAMRSPSPSPC